MLYGRNTERARIDALLDAARATHSSVLVVRGDAGIGKSELLGYAVERAGSLQVLRATGHESELGLAFAGLHQLLLPVLDCIEQLPPRQAQALLSAFGLATNEVDDRFLIAVAVLSLLGEAAADSGLLCAIDDAHRLDEPSAEALVFAARRLEAEGVLMLIALSEDETHPFAAEGLPILTLGGLSPDAAAALLQERAGPTLSPTVREQLVAWSDGNPLALTSLYDTLTPEQLDGREPLTEPLPIGEELQRVVLGRVRRLPADAQALLLLASADDRGDLPTLQWAAEALEIDFAALEDLRSSGFLHVTESGVDFSHSLLRSAVYRAASRPERRELHQALAAALKSDEDADRRAWHRAAAAIGPDEEIAHELERSALRARLRGGHAAAAATLERAVDLSIDETSRGRRLVAAAEANWLAGHTARVGPLVHRAEPLLTDAGLRSTAALLRGSFEIQRGMLGEAYRTLVAGALEAADRDAVAALEMLVRASDAAWLCGRADWAAEIGRVAETIARSGRSDEAFIVAQLIGRARILEGDYEGGVNVLRPAIGAADSFGHPRYLVTAGQAAFLLGDPVQAREHLSRAAAELRAIGAVGELPAVLAQLAATEAWLGLFASAAATASEGLRLASETGQANPASRCLANLALIDASQGRQRECRNNAREATQIAMRSGMVVNGAVAEWALGRMELAAGRPADAMRHLIRPTDRGSVFYHPAFMCVSGPDLVEAEIRCGRTDEARPVLANFERWAVHSGSSWARSVAARLHGLMSRGAAADRHFDAALSHGSEHGIPFEQARTQLLFSQHLRRSRRRTESRQHLQEALTIFESVGATPWAELARAELRAIGKPAPPRHPSALEELTPQERQIAQFVSQGASNREVATKLFLSPPTVDYHLQKIFAKLGIASRVKLMKLVADELGSLEETRGHA